MKIRFCFTKGEELKFIGHLDMMRLFQRCIRRAKLPMEYSKGFNPHMLLYFGLPLSLGMRSESEYGEVQLSENMQIQEFIDRLNSTLPDGLKITFASEVYNTRSVMAEVSAASYLSSVLRYLF